MAITLGTNIPSLNSHASLNNITKNLRGTMRKLSSGVKINVASDDAAGLVISQNMEGVIRCSDQAMANIQTASSFLTIAEDGLVTIGDHYQRINDLLENMANDTNSTESRTAAVEEIIERLKEINRLSEVTDFNGRRMLNGDNQSIIIQIGSDASELSTLDIAKALTNCHTSAGAMDTDLPYYLNPKAMMKPNPATPEDAEWVIPDEENGGWIDKDGNKLTDAEVEADYTESAYDPSNANCRKYMTVIQKAISGIAERRGLIGAYENRMESAYQGLTTRTESLKDAKGVYTDTDVAESATDLTTQQIMQQLNISILAMSNSMQQNALALIGG